MKKKLILLLLSFFCFNLSSINALDPAMGIATTLIVALTTGTSKTRCLENINWKEPLISTYGMGYVVGGAFGAATGLYFLKKYFSDKTQEKLKRVELNKLLTIQVTN